MFEPRRIERRIMEGNEVAAYATYQSKTSEPVLCPIRPEIADLIQSAPRLSEKHAFIPEAGGQVLTDTRSVMNNYYHSYLAQISKISGVKGVRAHRFRDTFAVDMLNRGMRIEYVSRLLGHTSIKTTEKHYSPWVKSQSDMLLREAQRAWNNATPKEIAAAAPQIETAPDPR
jgi:integrase